MIAVGKPADLVPQPAPWCDWCGERFTEEEPPASSSDEELHLDCLLRMAVGGLNHLCGLCRCHGGTLPADPVGMTRHEAAKSAAFYWRCSRPNQRRITAELVAE